MPNLKEDSEQECLEQLESSVGMACKLMRMIRHNERSGGSRTEGCGSWDHRAPLSEGGSRCMFTEGPSSHLGQGGVRRADREDDHFSFTD